DVEEKSSKVGFTVSIRLMSVAPTKAKAEANLKNLINAYGQFNRPHLGGLKKTKVYFKKWFVQDFVYKYLPLFKHKIVVNIEELATLYHFPGQDVTTPYIERVMSKTAAAPHNLPNQGLDLGISRFRGMDKPVHS